jgi:aminoglycoside N3'-acetyltransferase
MVLDPPTWATADIVADLRRLGVREGDVLMVHASLRKIGPVEGGAAAVLDALDEAVGPRGTLMMTLGAVVPHEWVNERPEAERAALLASEPPYDPLTAPALPEVGWLAEAFRRRTGTVVNDNPSGRFGARGAAAATLMRDTPWNDYYGPDSPLERFLHLGGRVLRLGADPETTTLLHYAEYLAAVPNKRRIRRHYRVVGPAGPVTRTMDCLNDETGIVDYPGEDEFAIILKAYLATRRVRTGRVGNAPSELIDGRDIVEFGARWMSENLAEWADPA